jgi:hypothetical protein
MIDILMQSQSTYLYSTIKVVQVVVMAVIAVYLPVVALYGPVTVPGRIWCVAQFGSLAYTLSSRSSPLATCSLMLLTCNVVAA